MPNSNRYQRIAYVVKRFPRFSETFIVNELLALQAQGHHVEVFSLLPPSDEPRHAIVEQLKCPVHYLPTRKALRHINIGQGIDTEQHDSLVNVLDGDVRPFASINPGKDIQTTALLSLQAMSLALMALNRGLKHIHAHFMSNPTSVAMLASRLSYIPYSFTAHARDIYYQYTNAADDNRMRAEKIREAAFVVTVSDYNREYLRAIAGDQARCNIRRLYNGIDLDRFKPSGEKPRTFRIIAVGRLVEKKGFSDLLKAIAILRDLGLQFEAVLIGEGPLRESLKQLSLSLGIERIVAMPGALTQEEILVALQQSHLMVLPCVVSDDGDRDGLPTVMLEAMAMGLPCISTRVAGIPEMIEDGVTGYLVKPHDPAAIADKAARLIALQDLAHSLGRAGRKRAENSFDLNNNVAQLASWFAESTFDNNQSRNETPCTFSM